MNTAGNQMVWFILIPIFLAVGIYLIIYSKKRKAMLKGFAQKNGFQYTPDDQGILETELNQKLAIEETGLVRSFMKVKDIVADGEISIFRCIELLDLNPHRNPEVTHQNHICASFSVPGAIDLFFVTDRDGHCSNLYPKDKNISEDEYFLKLKPIIGNNLPRNSVTISFRRGRAIIYVNPLVTGGEKEEDLEYLISLGKAIKNVFS